MENKHKYKQSNNLSPLRSIGNNSDSNTHNITDIVGFLFTDTMFRRKLSIYTLVFAIGIASGFIALEKSNLILGSVLLIYCGIVIALMEIDEPYDNASKLRIRMIVIMLGGFVIFSLRYWYYNSNIDIRDNQAIGTVNRINIKKDRTRIVMVSDELGGAKVNVILYEADRTIKPGDRIRVYGEYYMPDRQINPHCFDYGLYLMSEGIKYSFKGSGYEIITGRKRIYQRYRSYLYDKRLSFEKLITDDDIRAFIKGVVFGDKGEIDEEIINEFNENSTGHILAVSGLHIGFVFALLKRLTRKRRGLMTSLAIIAVVIMYGEMTMWSASTVRAVTVLSISAMAVYVRRPFDLLTSISMAAIGILMFNPYQMFNTGFQMSFIAMLGIVFIGPLLSSLLGEMAGSILAVQFATVPYVVLVFHRLNLLAALINLPVVMAASILVPMCIMVLALLSLTGLCPELIIRMIEGLAEIIIRSNHLMNLDGGLSNELPGPGVTSTLILYAAMYILCSEWARIRFLRHEYRCVGVIILLCIIPCLIGGFSANPLGSPELVFVSVGQGDALHIRAGSHSILIDGGGSRDYSIGEKVIKPYLLANGVGVLDAAMVTHLHMDHFKGIKELRETYPVKSLIIPYMYENNEEVEGEYSLIDRNGVIRLDDEVTVKAIWPISTSLRATYNSELNELNMVYLINYQGVKILVTGDQPAEEEEKMVRHYRGTDVLKCDILKVAHHGSKTSTTDILLADVKPSVAVISVGKNNVYGHPTAECLKRLSDRKIIVYRTDIQGAVGIDINRRGKYSVRTML